MARIHRTIHGCPNPEATTRTDASGLKKPHLNTASCVRFTTASGARRRSFGVIRCGVAREH
jgi:hypothetical protein